jgi:phage terminase large subunit GpA-like protein
MKARLNRLRASEVQFADPAKLLLETFDTLLPPRRITVAEHAEAHRWVQSPVGSHLVRWDHSTASYLTEIMDACSSGEHDTVAVVGPGACGKTMVAENWLLHSIEADPANLLWYMQTDPAKDAYVKGRIEPMLEAHEKLIGSLRHGRDSVEFKRFRSMRAEFLSFSQNNLVNKHVARIVADEVDAYDQSLGDFKALLDPRRQAAGSDSMLLAISHPDLGLPIQAPREKQRGIMAAYVDSDRRTYWWPCPGCGGFSSPNPGSGRRMIIDYPEHAPLDVIQQEARLICPHCQNSIEDHERGAMRGAAKWVGLGEEIDDDGRITGSRRRMNTAGFWIVGAMSPFVKDGIGGLARAKAAAERAVAAGGDDRGLRSVMVKAWGEPYQPPKSMGTVDAQALADRAEPVNICPRGYVPDGVRAITLAADAQGNRFELIARGWGQGMESWIIDHRVIPASPGTSAADWDDLLQLMATQVFPLADGSGRAMRARAATFDSYGQAGVTEQAYAAWLRAKRTKLARLAGRIRGRDGWMLVPAKGASGRNAPRITLAYPDTQRKDRKAAARGEVPVLFFNPNQAKDSLSAQLQRDAVGPGHIHIPAWICEEQPPHTWLEQLASETRDVRGFWSKIVDSARNEAVDLMCMSEAAARLHGMHRIDWGNPPAWAQEWQRNSMIVPWEAQQALPRAEDDDRPEPALAPVAMVAAVRRRPPPPRRLGRSSLMG